PCALARPRSTRCGVGAQSDGWYLGVRFRKSVAGMVELGSTADSCKKVGSGTRAYIVGVVDHPYLATQLPLWLTLSSYASTTPVVLAVDRTTTDAPIPASDQLPALGRPCRQANCPKER
ncbi:hypothetical protein GW17_00008914, partial [Ensete ventricosum]